MNGTRQESTGQYRTRLKRGMACISQPTEGLQRCRCCCSRCGGWWRRRRPQPSPQLRWAASHLPDGCRWRPRWSCWEQGLILQKCGKTLLTENQSKKVVTNCTICNLIYQKKDTSNTSFYQMNWNLFVFWRFVLQTLKKLVIYLILSR